MEKLDIICGKGKHRTWNAAFAEMILLNIYGQLPDYFWRKDEFSKKYLSFIKLIAKLGQTFSKLQIAYIIYTENSLIFNDQLGLVIWKLKNKKEHSIVPSNFSIDNLISFYKNKYRPQQPSNITNISLKPIIKTEEKDILGEL